MADELYEMRNFLLLGNYHQAVAEGTNARSASKKPEDVQAFNVERDSLIAQSQVMLGQFDSVLLDLKNATAPVLIATRHWAQLHKDLHAGLTADDSYRHLIALVGDTPTPALAPAAVLAAAAATFRGDNSSALKLATSWATAIDSKAHPRHVLALRAIAVDNFLRLHRVDLAEKELAAMKAVDDDAIQCLLSSVSLLLRSAHTKPANYSEAENLISEIVARCGQSVTLLNLLAIAKIGQGKPQEAEQHLLDALSKRSGDAETIANLAVVSAQLGKPWETSLRFISQDKASHSLWVKTFLNMQHRFHDAAAAAAAV